MRYIAASVLAIACVSTPAFAKDQDKTFSGPHIEAVAGFDRVNSSGDGQSGFGYGASAGYDLQFGKAVLGLEGEAMGSTTDECATGVLTMGDQLCVKAGRDLYAGGRLGVVAARNVLVYAKVGYTNARERAVYTLNGTKTNTGDNLDGVRFGGGVEVNFGKFLGKVEYRYSNYEQDVERHQVLAGLGVRF
jgi:outer membrane immunogenic protein